ncbi:hypothetical protein BH24PSE2_BH24PSE2_23240 [soil metagenome]
MTDEPEPDASVTRRRVVPLVLLLLFVGPLVLAWVLYSGGAGFGSGGATNHGELVQPPVPLPAIKLPQDTLLRDVWTLAHVGPPRCDRACRESLHETRQVWRALGRNNERVRRVYLQTEAGEFGSDLRAEHPDLTIALARPELLDAFPGADQPGRAWLVDPIGNLMMTYPAGSNPSGLLEDLERLLKLSRIG